MPVPTMIGRYRLGPRLGSGGYAVVWLAHDASLQTRVAIKVMADNWSEQTDLRERFLAEARLLRRASSSRIVRVFDVGELPDGRPYFVMEHADRGTLEDRIAHGRLPLVEALRVTAEVARGAAELHRVDIVHRDLKPSNVLIQSTPDGRERLLIADLGVAKNLTQGTGLTMSVGSAGYMAPEQSMSNSRVDARADVYSLGALGFDLVTGQQPPVSGPVLPKGSYPDLPEPIRKVLRRALESNRDRRWPDAASLADRLDVLADEFDSGVQPEPASPSRRSNSHPRSHPGSRGRRKRSQPHGWVRSHRVPLVGGLLIVALGGGQLWWLARTPPYVARPSGSVTSNETGGSAASDADAGAPTSTLAVPPTVYANGLDDGDDYYGLLERSGQGTITVTLIRPLGGTDAAQECRKSLGPVPVDAVCRQFYVKKLESSPRTLRVNKNALISYVSYDNGDQYTIGTINGAGVANLSGLTQSYQQGRTFQFTLKNGIVRATAPVIPPCREITGLKIDGRSEWTSKCVKREL